MLIICRQDTVHDEKMQEKVEYYDHTLTSILLNKARDQHAKVVQEEVEGEEEEKELKEVVEVDEVLWILDRVRERDARVRQGRDGVMALAL